MEYSSSSSSTAPGGGGDNGGTSASACPRMAAFWAVLYILTGILQPLTMTMLKQAGLASPTAQLYMMFYYMFPGLLIFTTMGWWTSGSSSGDGKNNNNTNNRGTFLSLPLSSPTSASSSSKAAKPQQAALPTKSRRIANPSRTLGDLSRNSSTNRENSNNSNNNNNTDVLQTAAAAAAAVVTTATTTTIAAAAATTREAWPTDRRIIYKSASVAVFDIMAQAMNYTGAALAGPTIFIIVYSSVAVWTAVFSRVLLDKRITVFQWTGVWTVFAGLALAATDSVQVGDKVAAGTLLVLLGAAMHAVTYVLSERFMTPAPSMSANDDDDDDDDDDNHLVVMDDVARSPTVTCGAGGAAASTKMALQRAPSSMNSMVSMTLPSPLASLSSTASLSSAVVSVSAVSSSSPECLSARQQTAIQGCVGFLVLFFWQIFYTVPRYRRVLAAPMQDAGTDAWSALQLLSLFGLLSLVHMYSLYYTLKHFPGGSTSAGVLKGLQAVLVFVATDQLYCGTAAGGAEMCFTKGKVLSLAIVVLGVVVFGISTPSTTSSNQRRRNRPQHEIVHHVDNDDDDDDDDDLDRSSAHDHDGDDDDDDDNIRNGNDLRTLPNGKWRSLVAGFSRNSNNSSCCC